MTGAGYMIALGFGVFAGIALIALGGVLWRRMEIKDAAERRDILVGTLREGWGG